MPGCRESGDGGREGGSCCCLRRCCCLVALFLLAADDDLDGLCPAEPRDFTALGVGSGSDTPGGGSPRCSSGFCRGRSEVGEGRRRRRRRRRSGEGGGTDDRDAAGKQCRRRRCFSFVCGCLVFKRSNAQRENDHETAAKEMQRMLLPRSSQVIEHEPEQQLGKKKKNSPRSSEGVRPGVKRTTPTTRTTLAGSLPPLAFSLKETPISHAASGGATRGEASGSSDAARPSSRRAARTQGWTLRSMAEGGGIRSSRKKWLREQAR